MHWSTFSYTLLITCKAITGSRHKSLPRHTAFRKKHIDGEISRIRGAVQKFILACPTTIPSVCWLHLRRPRSLTLAGCILGIHLVASQTGGKLLISSRCKGAGPSEFPAVIKHTRRGREDRKHGGSNALIPLFRRKEKKRRVTLYTHTTLCTPRDLQSESLLRWVLCAIMTCFIVALNQQNPVASPLAQPLL